MTSFKEILQNFIPTTYELEKVGKRAPMTYVMEDVSMTYLNEIMGTVEAQPSQVRKVNLVQNLARKGVPNWNIS